MKVSHVMLRVSDMADALRFYRDVVGLGVISESPGFSFLDGGTIRVALATPGEVSSDETNTEIVLEVDDIATTYHTMAARGVPFEIEPRCVMSHDGADLYAAHFRDPDGHLWSVTGWVPSPESSSEGVVG